MKMISKTIKTTRGIASAPVDPAFIARLEKCASAEDLFHLVLANGYVCYEAINEIIARELFVDFEVWRKEQGIGKVYVPPLDLAAIKPKIDALIEQAKAQGISLPADVGRYPWDAWQIEALLMGVDPELAELGRSTMRQHYNHTWDDFDEEVSLAAGPAMLDKAINDPTGAQKRWEYLLNTDGERIPLTEEALNICPKL